MISRCLLTQLMEERNDAATRIDRRTMVADQTSLARPKERSWKNGLQQPTICKRGAVDRQNRCTVAGPARTIWSLEFRVPTVQPLVQARYMGASSGTTWRRPRLGAFAAGLDHRSGSSTCGRRERGLNCHAFGRSRGGWSTKIHAAVNGNGQPVRFALTDGERHDMAEASTLLTDLSPQYVVADKGYDSDPLRQRIRRLGAKPVIPARKGTRRRRYDHTRYKLRNVVERFFN